MSSRKLVTSILSLFRLAQKKKVLLEWGGSYSILEVKRTQAGLVIPAYGDIFLLLPEGKAESPNVDKEWKPYSGWTDEELKEYKVGPYAKK